MKQVYLFEPGNASGKVAPATIIVKSSREKAISHCNREFNKPDFVRRADSVIVVSAGGRLVGWITKKIVQ